MREELLSTVSPLINSLPVSRRATRTCLLMGSLYDAIKTGIAGVRGNGITSYISIPVM